MLTRTTTLVLLASTAALAITSRCPAPDFRAHMEVYEHPEWSNHGYEGLVTYRLYAQFVEPDGVLAVFGLPGSELMVKTGNRRLQNAFGELTAPADLTSAGIWANQWDSYVTINATTAAGDATFLGPDFAEETNGLLSDFSTTSTGWLVTPDDEQRLPNKDGTVLLAQFTVEPQNCGDQIPDVWGLVNYLTGDGEERNAVRFTGSSSKMFDYPCADLNEDRIVNFEDVVVVIVRWGDEVPCKPDLSRNGVVDFADILWLFTEWGPCIENLD